MIKENESLLNKIAKIKKAHKNSLENLEHAKELGIILVIKKESYMKQRKKK